MSIECLDHVNVRTANLDAMRQFYRDVLDLEERLQPGKRAGFWYWCRGRSVLHLITAEHTDHADRPQIEHFAFRATGLAGAMARIDALHVAYNLNPTPEQGLVQLNLRDPDGNRVHLDFPIEEYEPAMVPGRVSTR